MSLTIGTIGEVIDNGYTITAYCYRFGCNHGAELDLDVLAARFGRHHSSMHDDLTPKLRCSECGSKNIGLRLSPPTGFGRNWPCAHMTNNSGIETAKAISANMPRNCSMAI